MAPAPRRPWARLDAAIDARLCGPIAGDAGGYHESQFARQAPLLRTIAVFTFIAYLAFWQWDAMVQGAFVDEARQLRLLLALPLGAIGAGVFIGSPAVQFAAFRAFLVMLMASVCAVTYRSPAALEWALPTYMLLPLVTAPFMTRWRDAALLLAVMALVPSIGVTLGKADRVIAFNYLFYLAVGGIGVLLLFVVAERTRRRAYAMHLQIKRFAELDVLTGLLMRRRFMHLATRQLAQHRGASHALAYLDLDHFKAINDDFGHDAGDHALHAIGRVLQDAAPPGSLSARLGGEEFVVMMPPDEPHPDAACEALRTAVQRIEVQGRALTTSIGLALRYPSESLEALMQRADTALLVAKRNGRDRVQLADDRRAPTA